MKSNALVTKMRDDAAEIGELYQKARKSAVESVCYLIEAGKRLNAIKKPMKHGEWLPWLKANEQALGFGRQTAWLLMKAATNVKSTLLSDLTPEKAREITSKVWGNTKRKKSSARPRKNTSAEAEAAARSILDEGKTYSEVEKKSGVSNIVLRSAVAREEGRREARNELVGNEAVRVTPFKAPPPSEQQTGDQKRQAYVDFVHSLSEEDQVKEVANFFKRELRWTYKEIGQFLNVTRFKI